jgi:anti-sigma factor RsiW
MNCARARRWLALFAGADLPSRKARRLEKHLEGCPGCRKELEELRAALAGIQAAAARETLDWPEGEWKGLMAQVRSEKPRPRPVPVFNVFPRKAWAAGFLLVLALFIAGLILRAILFSPGRSPLSEIITATATQPSRALMKEEVSSKGYPKDAPFSVQKGRGATTGTVLAARRSPEKATQDLMSMTLVSQETGLRIHWTFNKNFDWEEKKQ